MMQQLTPKKRKPGRPPKTQNGFNQTRSMLLYAGVVALTEKGYSSTGIDEILKSVNIPKGSFYHFFKNKEAFGLEMIDIYANYFNKKLDRYLLDISLTPLERINAFCQDAEKSMKKYDYHRGCLVGNLGQEMAQLPNPIVVKLIDTFASWEKRIENCLDQAARDGEISLSVNCKDMAQLFWIGWEGAVLRAKLEKSPHALFLFSRSFIQLLKLQSP